MKISKYKNIGQGWHNESIRHSNAVKYGTAGGIYAKELDKFGSDKDIMRCPNCRHVMTDVGYLWCKNCNFECSYLEWNKQKYSKDNFKNIQDKDLNLKNILTVMDKKGLYYEEIVKKNYTNDVMNRINGRKLLYMNKENRDKAFEILKSNGIVSKKGNVSNQQIHPEYIEDYEGTIEVGFGNTMYRTPFKKLYKLEVN